MRTLLLQFSGKVSVCHGRASLSALSERIDWYGAYDFFGGQCFIWNESFCNQAYTSEFLRHVAAWPGDGPAEVVRIWDGAPWHKAKRVQAVASELGFTIMALPSYSPQSD